MTKYGPLGYRLAHLDAGVALAQLDTIAAGKRVAMDVRADVNGEAISRLLQLDDETEAVTAVAVVRNADHRELSDADR
jgi:selenocysteine-specific translation elongation factor